MTDRGRRRRFVPVRPCIRRLTPGADEPPSATTFVGVEIVKQVVERLHPDHPAERPLPVKKRGKRGYIQWTGADYEPRSERSSSLIRICLVPFPRNADRSLRSGVLRCGKSGPAQIRTAVTATRRPKDAKLPHRPALEGKRRPGIILALWR